MNKRRLTAIIAAAAIGGGILFLQACGKPEKPEPKLDTAKIDRGPIVAKVTATGTLSALVTVQVGSQVSGRVAQILVDFNSPVTKGQVIAKIDPQLFQAALEQGRANALAARANLRKAQAQAADSERQFTRSKSLAERKLISQADLDTAQANRDAASAQVDAASGAVAQAEAALHQAQVNLDYTTIVSPINGVVISRNVDVGQTVAASLQAPTLFVIAEDLRKMQVDTSVAEADIGKLSPGMSASFIVDAFPGKKFDGTVRQIRNAAQTVQNVVTYDAVIDVDNDALELRPGMTANVTFIYAKVDDALRVPNAALRFRPPPSFFSGGPSKARGAAAATSSTAGSPRAPRGREAELPANQRTVWVRRGPSSVPVKIKTGVSDGSLTEVVEGELHDGDLAITAAAGAEGGGAGGPPRGGFRLF